MQLLWVNLVTDGLPALALGVEPKHEGLMERCPRDPDEGVLDSFAIRGILWHGACIMTVTLAAFIYGLYWTHLQPRGHETFKEALGMLFHAPFWAGLDLRNAGTLAFTTLAFAQLAHSLNCRSETRSLFELGWGSNLPLLLAVSVSVLAQLAVVYIPFVRPAFDTVPITGSDLAVLASLSLTPLVFGELRKVWLRRARARPMTF